MPMNFGQQDKSKVLPPGAHLRILQEPNKNPIVRPTPPPMRAPILGHIVSSMSKVGTLQDDVLHCIRVIKQRVTCQRIKAHVFALWKGPQDDGERRPC